MPVKTFFSSKNVNTFLDISFILNPKTLDSKYLIKWSSFMNLKIGCTAGKTADLWTWHNVNGLKNVKY